MIHIGMLYMFQPAASAMCYRLGLDPNQSVSCPPEIDANGGLLVSRWAIFAAQMKTHLLMLESMREFGMIDN